MGKGDRKTAKGKRSSSSYGNTRPHRVAADGAAPAAVAPPPAAPAKAPAARKTAAKKKA